MVSGHTYEGTFINGLKEGHGIVYYAGGTSHKGNFVNNAIEGIGKTVYNNEAFYEGEFKKNFRHGVGKLVTNVNTVEGVWKNNLRVSIKKVIVY